MMSQVVKAVKDRQDIPFDLIKSYAAKSYKVDIADIKVVSVSNGYGRHIHDEECAATASPTWGCMRHFDDSDWIVEVEYDKDGHRAGYGVLDGEFSLWMD